MGFFDQQEIAINSRITARRAGHTSDGGIFEIEVTRSVTLRTTARSAREVEEVQRAHSLAEGTYMDEVASGLRALEWGIRGLPAPRGRQRTRPMVEWIDP